jgi:prevent-host-death family protein
MKRQIPTGVAWSCYDDHGYEEKISMRKIAAGTFKARCLRIMQQVQATGETVMVTKRGAPLVNVTPVAAETDDIFGCMADKVKIIGDIESPIPVEWEITKK